MIAIVELLTRSHGRASFQTISPKQRNYIREEPQNLFSLKFIGPSKRWNFENRTESAESRASEINGPFGE
jgi:hypothetical protein